MKKSTIQIICLLLLAAMLSACGIPAEPAPTTAPTQAATEAVQTEPTQTEPIQTEPVQTAPVQTEAQEYPAEGYRRLLAASPALEGEHPELMTADFGNRENYAKFGMHYDSYVLRDLDGDGYSELITQSMVNFRWSTLSVFTLVSGNATLVKTPEDGSYYGSLEQNSAANGAYITYFCEANHLHSVWRGMTPVGEMEENYAYTMADQQLIPVDCTLGASVWFADIAQPNPRA